MNQRSLFRPSTVLRSTILSAGRTALACVTVAIMLAGAPAARADNADKNTSPVTGKLPDAMRLELVRPTPPPEPANRQPLTISFCTRNMLRQCVTPDRKMNKRGKLQRTGVTLTPAIAGEWRWRDDYTLSFQPAKPWPAASSFAVAIDPHVYSDTITIASPSYAFTSSPLEPTIASMEFFQDQTDLKKRGVGATITFNTPVDEQSLHDHLVPTLEELTDSADPAKKKIIAKAEHLPFELKMNGLKTQANVTVPLDVLPDQERFLRINLTNGIAAKFGGATSLTTNGGKYEQRVLIPSRSSYLKVTSVSATIVKNAEGAPDQIVTFELNAPVSTAEFKKAVAVKLLPKDKPSPTPGQSPKKDYQWSTANEVTADVLKSATPVEITVLPIEGESANLLTVRLRGEPGRWMHLTVAKGLPADGGYLLGADHVVTAKVPDWGKEVKILSEGSLLSLSGEKKLSIYSLGVEKIEYDVARVRTNELQHLISQTSGEFSRPSFENWLFGADNISERTTTTVALASADPSKPQYSVFDFTPYLAKEPEKHGVFYLTISGKRRGTDGSDETVSTDKRLVVITDLGFSVKTNRDQSAEMFVQSFKAGSALPGVQVDVLGTNGLPVFTAKTDEQGHVSLPNISMLSREKRPVAYVARLGNDMSFMPYSRMDRAVDYSRFETGGNSGGEDGLRAFLFSDRGIYRPGELAHIGMIVKESDWSKSLDGMPLLVELSNPRGTTIEKKLLKLNSYGLVDYDFSTEDSSPTGYYSVTLSIAENGQAKTFLGSTAVRVEEFLPDTMKIASVFNKEATEGGWVTPDGLTAEVTLRHLYGAPAQGNRVRGTININPGAFEFPQFAGYAFFDPKRTERSFDQEAGDETTDENGVAKFPLNLATYGDSTYRLTFYGEGFAEGSGRSVKTARSVLVSSAPYVVGYKASGNLEFINKGVERGVRLVAVNSKLQQVASEPLSAKLTKLTYISALVKDPSGQYRYKSVSKESDVSSKEISVPAAGLDLPLETAQPGTYILTLLDAKGVKRCRVQYNVVGAATLAQHERKEAVIQVKLNKTSYQPGETAELSIVSPYTGTGIISLEAEKVHSFQWFHTETESSVQKFQIPADFSGKGYLNVQFVRSVNSPEVFTDPFAFNITPVFVSTEARNSKVELKTLDKILPGEPLAIHYKTKEKGKIAVFAIDEGILLYGRYTTPDPLSYLVNRRALQVETKQIFDLLLPEYSLLMQNSAPGGDAALADGTNLNPFKRKTLPPVAYWSGIIDTEAGEHEVTYQVPSYFNGSLRVMAVAVTDTSVGAAETRTEVKGELILSPNAPTFVAPGDDFVVGSRIANYRPGSGANASVKVTAAVSEQLEVIGDSTFTLTVPEGREVPFSLHLKAKDLPGGASIIFRAESGTASTSYESTLSVRPAVPSMTTLVTGYVDGKEKNVTQDRPVYDAFSSVSASVSTLPLSILPGLRAYLDNYPYGCSEQLLSKVFPSVVLYGEQELQTKRVDGDVFKTTSHVFGQIRERQLAGGGLSMWGYGGAQSDFITVYGLHVMTLAKEKNLPVPDELFQSLLEAVRTLVNRSVSSLPEARQHAYGIYLLTRNGVVTSNYIPYILQYAEANQKGAWKNDLTAVYLAATYQLLQLKPEADALLKEFTLGEPKYWAAHSKYWRDTDDQFYDSLIRYSQYLTLLSDHFPEQLKTLDRNVLFRIANFVGEGSFNTTSSSYAVLALVSYARATHAQLGGTLTVSQRSGESFSPVELIGKLIKEATLAPTTREIRFTSDGTTGIFYQLSTTGFDRTLPSAPVDQGIEVSRRIVNRDGNDATTVKIGDSLDVVVTLRALGEEDVNNIALVDLIPGGFEVVPNSMGKPASSTEEDSSSVSEEEGEGEEGGEGESEEASDATTETHADEPEESPGPVWTPTANDVREDRLIAYGTLTTDPLEYRYKIKAVNAGAFTVPPTFAESMYERSVKARGVPGKLTVEP